MQIKTTTVQVKTLGDGVNGLEAGEFTAYAAVFGNKDSYGDVIVPGAFTDTLVDWSKSNNPIPVYWAHQMANDPTFNIGEIVAAEEDEKGLLVRAKLDLEGNPKAAYVHRLLKGGRVNQMSFAYDVQDSAYVKSEDLGEYLELRKLKLHEVSVVPVGANQETEVLSVKALADQIARSAVDGVKAGRVLSAKNLASLADASAALKAAGDTIDAVIKAATGDDGDDQAKASGNGTVKDEAASDGGKSGTPATGPSADYWAAQLKLVELGTP